MKHFIELKDVNNHLVYIAMEDITALIDAGNARTAVIIGSSTAPITVQREIHVITKAMEDLQLLTVVRR